MTRLRLDCGDYCGGMKPIIEPFLGSEHIVPPQ